MNNKKQYPVRLLQESIKEVDKFVYLGSVVSKDGDTARRIHQVPNQQSTIGLQHPPASLEISSSLASQQDPDL